jgi:hypothetical protein
MEKPLPALPSTGISPCLLPAGGSRGNTLAASTSTAPHESVAPEAAGLGISLRRVDTPGPTAVCKPKKPEGDDWATIAHKAYDRAKAKADLTTRVSQKLTSHLQTEIARCEHDLEKLNPDNRLSTHCNSLSDLPSGLNTEAARVKANLVKFQQMLQCIGARRESATASLENQAQALYFAQLGINANFEQAFLSAKMLKASDLSPPSAVQKSDVDHECRALCSKFGIELGEDEKA